MGDLLHLGAPQRPRCGMRRGVSAAAWYARGCALEATDPAAAAHAYERALAGRPDLADAHNNLARLLHEGGVGPAGGPGAPDRLAVAESRYRLAICARPTVALYWFNLGVVVEDQRRFAEAIAAYERALELEPRLADAHFNLARLLEQVGRVGMDDLVLRRAVGHLVRYRQLVA